MNKYIDAEKLISEIDKKWKELADKNVKVGGGKYDIEISTYLSIKNLITRLQQEQPEVVLTDNASFTKELKRFLSDTGNEKKRCGVVLPIIKHFYELGLNAKK